MDKTIQRILSFTVILLFIQPIYAESASITNINIFNTGKRLVLNASLKDGFSEEIVEAIDSGIPVRITYSIVLKRKTPLFLDKRVVVRKIKKSVKYDTLKEEYKLIDNNGKRTITTITNDFDEVLRIMTKLESIHLISNKRINENEKYYVRVKAELNSKRTWFPFNYILLFMPFLNFDTSWENSSSYTVK